jgi:hypothetical protein
MIQEFWHYLSNLLQNNQIFSGGLVLMVGGALLAYFRQVPAQIYQFVRRRVITEIDILDRKMVGPTYLCEKPSSLANGQDRVDRLR